MSTRLIPTPRLLFVLAAGLVPLALAAQVRELLWAVAAYDAVPAACRMGRWSFASTARPGRASGRSSPQASRCA